VTAIGAAYLAGLAVRFWENVEEIQKQWKINRRFEPAEDDKEDLIKGWYRAIKAVNAWSETENPSK
jgi:glycerol kinase